MSKGLLFWIIMIIWFLSAMFNSFPSGNYFIMGGTLLQFALFFLLGWAAFGFVIKD